MKLVLNEEFAEKHEITTLSSFELYDDLVNESYEPIDVLGYKYEPADVQKKVDLTAYQEGVNNYIDALISDGEVTEFPDGTLVYSRDLEKVLEELEENAS